MVALVSTIGVDNKLAQQRAIIVYLSYELPLDYADIQNLDSELFDDGIHKLIVTIVKKIWQSPSTMQPRASDIAFELEELLIRLGYSKQEAKKLADDFEFLSEKEPVPDINYVLDALSKFGVNLSDEDDDSNHADLVPNLFDYKLINLTEPHESPLKDIVDQLKFSAKRRADMCYVHAGFQCLSVLAIVMGFVAINGFKLSLMTIVFAITGYGKEHAFEFYEEFCAKLKLKKYLFGRPRTDKDLIFNLLKTQGKSFYSLDEVQRLFNGASSKNASIYVSSIFPELLTLSTTNSAQISGIHQDIIKEKYVPEQAKLLKEIADKQKEIDASNNTKERAKLKKELATKEKFADSINWILNAAVEGIDNPRINLFMATQPVNADKVITQFALDEGLLGRIILAFCPEKRSKIQQNRKEVDWDVITELVSKAQSTERNIKLTEEAQTLLNEICVRLDEDDLLNHTEYGALYARVFQQTCVLASLLAITSGKVTVNDIMYCFAIAMNHVEDTAYFLKQTAINFSSDEKNIYDALLSRILKVIKDAGASGIVISRLKQNVMRKKQFKALEKKLKVEKRDLFNEIVSKLVLLNEVKREGAKFYIN